MGRDTFLFGLGFMVLIAVLTLTLSIEMYDGVAVMANGELMDEKLSLSYLVNKTAFLQGYEAYGVVDIQLKTLGWIMIGILNFGFPFLLGFRVAVARHKKRAQL